MNNIHLYRLLIFYKKMCFKSTVMFLSTQLWNIYRNSILQSRWNIIIIFHRCSHNHMRWSWHSTGLNHNQAKLCTSFYQDYLFDACSHFSNCLLMIGYHHHLFYGGKCNRLGNFIHFKGKSENLESILEK